MDSQLPYGEMIALAKEGSPMLINSVARLAGLGEGERKQLVSKGVPVWAWALLAGAVGVVIGARVHKSMPDKLPVWLVGK